VGFIDSMMRHESEKWKNLTPDRKRLQVLRSSLFVGIPVAILILLSQVPGRDSKKDANNAAFQKN